MSLRDDVKEAMAVALEEHGYTFEAGRVREEEWTEMGGLVAAQAALSVCDKYEPMEVQQSDFPDCLWLRGNPHWMSQRPSFTVYRKKQKPEPETVEVTWDTLAELKEFARESRDKTAETLAAIEEAEKVL